MNGRSTEPLHISQWAIALPPQPHFKVEFHKPINSHGHLKYSILHSIVMFLDLCTHIMTSESVTRIVGLHRPVNLHVQQIALCGQDWDIVKMNIGEWISRFPEKSSRGAVIKRLVTHTLGERLLVEGHDHEIQKDIPLATLRLGDDMY